MNGMDAAAPYDSQCCPKSAKIMQYLVKMNDIFVILFLYSSTVFVE